jgi:DNA polymerase I-like protein with 3'-5' exonuclease and polymerase domains
VLCVVCSAAGGPAQVEPALRERAKRVTYGIIYGVSAYGLASQLQVCSFMTSGMPVGQKFLLCKG